MQNFSEIWVILLDYKSAVSLHFSVWKMAASLRARENFGATAAWSTDDGDGLGAPMSLVGLGRVIFHFLMGWVAWNSHSATFSHIFPSWSGQFWTHLWTQHRRRGSFSHSFTTRILKTFCLNDVRHLFSECFPRLCVRLTSACSIISGVNRRSSLPVIILKVLSRHFVPSLSSPASYGSCFGLWSFTAKSNRTIMSLYLTIISGPNEHTRILLAYSFVQWQMNAPVPVDLTGLQRATSELINYYSTSWRANNLLTHRP